MSAPRATAGEPTKRRLARPLRLLAGALVGGLLAGPCAAPPAAQHRLADAVAPAVATPEAGESFLAERARVGYVVRANDTLGAIAASAGVRLDALLAANPELAADPRRVEIGQRVEIPLAPRPAAAREGG
jgi:LysM repeat protein